MFATGGTLVMPWRTADGWNRIFRRVIHLGRDGAGTGWGLDSARVAPKVALLFIYRLSEDSLPYPGICSLAAGLRSSS